MKILVICGAGASSTFVAQRLRRAAESAGLGWETAAGTAQSVTESSADLILVGPHLKVRAIVLREVLPMPIAVLPDDIFNDRDGRRTLALARAALAEPRTTSEGRS
jgi:PTS system cellobiose-specific IIB component